MLNKARQHEGARSDEEISAVIDRLREPLASVSYADSGELKVEKGEHTIEAAYVSLEQADKEPVGRYIQHLLEKGVRPENASAKVDLWKKLTKLRYSTKGQEFDVLAIMPAGSRIFFCPTETEFVTGGVSSRQNVAWIVGDVAAPASLITLLHEVGHTVDDKNLLEQGVESLVVPGENADVAEQVRKERMASAFALKVMRPFLDDAELRNDVITFLEDYGLGSHYESAQSTINVRAILTRHAMSEWHDDEAEYQNNYFYDAWEKWKVTDAYKEWKQRPENQKLDPEYEEYGAWRSWVEESKYDFEKDIGGET